eukprot:CAMPEP_0172777996 /NCGR_PEP_ID=MMETSP1074-20121228/201686_1 /TAXON_ID=2916 /ORGANISM="Ceratium fusus, Strain PA161109" /LENGTH=193 /DNA_ID=CAMNT_0013614925 /DNA_START=92 /DNA_END=673 /DNA_ORIENTATION=+
MTSDREEDGIIVDSEAAALEEARRAAETQAAQMEEERQLAEEEERRRLDELRGEQERLQRLAKAEAEERERKRQQEEEEARQKQEAERQEREHRKATLDEFFQRWGFDGVNLPKKGGGCSVIKPTVTYPLHKAAELKDDKIVGMLLQERADVNQTNSANMTPVQVAKKNDKGNSHSEVLRLFGANITPTSGGA